MCREERSLIQNSSFWFYLTLLKQYLITFFLFCLLEQCCLVAVINGSTWVKFSRICILLDVCVSMFVCPANEGPTLESGWCLRAG